MGSEMAQGLSHNLVNLSLSSRSHDGRRFILRFPHNGTFNTHIHAHTKIK